MCSFFIYWAAKISILRVLSLVGSWGQSRCTTIDERPLSILVLVLFILWPMFYFFIFLVTLLNSLLPYPNLIFLPFSCLSQLKLGHWENYICNYSYSCFISNQNRPSRCISCTTSFSNGDLCARVNLLLITLTDNV